MPPAVFCVNAPSTCVRSRPGFSFLQTQTETHILGIQELGWGVYPGRFAMGVDRQCEAHVFPLAFVRRDYCPGVFCMGGFYLDLKSVSFPGHRTTIYHRSRERGARWCTLPLTGMIRKMSRDSHAGRTLVDSTSLPVAMPAPNALSAVNAMYSSCTRWLRKWRVRRIHISSSRSGALGESSRS